MMTLVRLMGFATLECGCLVGRYREVAHNREVDYIEEKGVDCSRATHKRNQVVPLREHETRITVFAAAQAI
jgi:hypothetical protein